jgi:hypothetical protein
MARYDREFGGQGGFRPRGGDWGGYDDDYPAGPGGRGFTLGGGNNQGGFAGPGGRPDFGHWNHYGGRGGFLPGLGGASAGQGGYGSGTGGYHGQGGLGSGTGGYPGAGPYQGGYGRDYQSQRGGYTYGGGQRRQGGGYGPGNRGGAMYGGSLERWGGGGYQAYDRGIYGEDYPGPANWSGSRGGTGYIGGGGRASQGRGYDRGWGGGGEFARAPFMPEEAYRRHPEYDQPQHSQLWDAYGVDDEEDLSDDDVREWVRRRMASDAWLDPDRIEVEVEDGVVTLTGEVDDFLEARYAWDDAWESPGVRGVVNNLTVRTDLVAETHGDVVPQSSGERPNLEAGGATLWSESGGTES